MATYTYNQSGNTTNYGDWNPSVSQLQQQLNQLGAHLEVDGKYGPETQSAFQQYGSQIQSGGQNNSQTTAQILESQYGLDPSLIAQLTPQQTAFLGPTLAYLNQYAANGNIVGQVNAGNIIQAWNAAASDPMIQSQFTDELAMDKSDVANQLQYLGQQYGYQEQQDAVAFRNQQAQNAQTQSQQGTALSGAAHQAKEDLNKEQKGVIQSERASNLKNVQNLGNTLESKYGSSGLGQFGNLSLGRQGYTPVGGLYGSVPVAQQNATTNAAIKNFQNIQYPGSTPA